MCSQIQMLKMPIYRETFVAVGGFNDLENGTRSRFDTIYEYDSEREAWLLFADHLSEKVYATTAMIVNANDFPACN